MNHPCWQTDNRLCRSSAVYQLRADRSGPAAVIKVDDELIDKRKSSAFRLSQVTPGTRRRPSGSARSSQTSQCSRSPSAETRARIYQERNKNRVRFDSGNSAGQVFIGSGAVPLVEGGGTLFEQHRHGAVEGAAVLALHRVHVARFHHVHRRRHQGGAETGGKGGGEVARHVVCGEQDICFDEQRGKKQNKQTARECLRSPVISSCARMSSLMMS